MSQDVVLPASIVMTVGIVPVRYEPRWVTLTFIRSWDAGALLAVSLKVAFVPSVTENR